MAGQESTSAFIGLPPASDFGAAGRRGKSARQARTRLRQKHYGAASEDEKDKVREAVRGEVSDKGCDKDRLRSEGRSESWRLDI
jgi:hypothetical protein